MDINPEDYLNVTRNLSLGSSTKVSHVGCSASACLRIENKLEGFSFYCFKCNEYHFSSSWNSPRERLRRQEILLETKRTQDAVSYDLPSDFSRTLPPEGLAWLGVAGWTLEMQERYNIGWSPGMNRVILPIKYKGVHSGYTARSVHKWLKPKYIEKTKDGAMWKSYTESINGEKPPKGISAPCNSCVICEDILSAGRCGEYLQTYSILGTSLSTALLTTLSEYRTLLLWLDPDKGGEQGLLKMTRRLRMFCDVKIIRSKQDPKLLTNQEIKFKIQEVLHLD